MKHTQECTQLHFSLGKKKSKRETVLTFHQSENGKINCGIFTVEYHTAEKTTEGHVTSEQSNSITFTKFKDNEN